MFAASDRLSEAFEEMKEKLEDEEQRTDQGARGPQGQGRNQLQEKPDITWHRAVRLIVDPDAPEDRTTKMTDDDDDEDLSDVS